jgi:hypothetical protein
MSDIPDHRSNRDEVIDALRGELLGPRPVGTPVDCSGTIAFERAGPSYDPHVQKQTGEEILTSENPLSRYGVGVLHPEELALEPVGEDEGPENATGDEPMSEEEAGSPEIETIGGDSETEETDDFDLSMTNASRMCSMAVSFLADLPPDARVSIDVEGGRYRAHNVMVDGQKRNSPWWLRDSVSISYRPSASDLIERPGDGVRLSPEASVNTEDLNLTLEVVARPHGKGQHLLTVSLINRTPVQDSELRKEEAAFFQTGFEVEITDRNGAPLIQPYPESQHRSGGSGSPAGKTERRERESLNLLYRHAKTYAVGHGCAADWEKIEDSNRVPVVSAEALPVFEVRSITPDIRREDGSEVKVSMADLAGLGDPQDGMEALRELVSLYEEWIAEKTDEISTLVPRHREAAERHMERASRCAERMREGIDLLQEDATVRRAFRLANEAILRQQIRGKIETREARYTDGGGRRPDLEFSRDHPEIDLLNPPEGLGKWRAFQIAFLLMSIASASDGTHMDRETVELIWFPTGGGKTEAYLGLAAFSIFLRYLRDPGDHGTHVLMRYTLRLLTAQQFQRASGLICAMEKMRRDKLDDVKTPISIGIWLGGSTTPNTRNQAKRNLRDLQRKKPGTENKFVVTECPWCGAEMGPVSTRKKLPNVLGYHTGGDSVDLKCPDSNCAFDDGLPIHVVDEDVYDVRPDLVIGTVDKFAMLAWRPEARSLFGLDDSGDRDASPPGLIIQDELHLISGPLGSMVGLYEGMIEELCTDRRGDDADVRPKIVSSTATIRRYEDQIRDLYGRDDVTLFPPPGLEQGDSFFARYATDEDGNPMPGRKYVGIYAPGLPSMQTTQVRAFSSLLAAPAEMTPAEQDPWRTLLLFYNSLRELGGALSLFQSDIPQYLNGLQKRLEIDKDDRRYLDRVLELTGRISGDEVTRALSRLETPVPGNGKPVDACLASSIIEVGVDIDRLSLMSVVGQPKTTSQYIQVTGRVGRRWWERPGIVATLYSASKPRDRSHYEKFRSYHERLYAQVEPTSATPFSPPALDRALHAVMISYIRQTESKNRTPDPPPSEALRELRDLFRERVERVDEDELDTFEAVFEKRIQQWERWERTDWTTDDEDPGLMRRAGSYAPPSHRRVSWEVPMSMRNVDADCRLQIDLPSDN